MPLIPTKWDATGRVLSGYSNITRTVLCVGCNKVKTTDCFKRNGLDYCNQCSIQKRIVTNHLCRAKRKGFAATLTLQEWVAILEKYNYRCAYCGGDYEVLEHILSLRFGGGTTKDNCVPSCRSCNRLKAGTTKRPLFIFDRI